MARVVYIVLISVLYFLLINSIDQEMIHAVELSLSKNARRNYRMLTNTFKRDKLYKSSVYVNVPVYCFKWYRSTNMYNFEYLRKRITTIK